MLDFAFVLTSLVGTSASQKAKKGSRREPKTLSLARTGIPSRCVGMLIVLLL